MDDKDFERQELKGIGFTLDQVQRNFSFMFKVRIPLTGWHWTKALPSNPGGHLHIGMWDTTSQSAFCAQASSEHGLTHLLRKQALSLGQSEFKTHSGRQPIKGSPWYSARQVQIPLLQTAFEPQGFGLHGSSSIGSSSEEMFCFLHEKWNAILD